MSLSRNDADLAIRFTQHPPETLVGRRLTRIAYGLYAARGPAGARFTLENPSQWDWIGLQDDFYNRMLHEGVKPDGPFKHRVDSMTATQAMAGAGLGVTILPCYIADKDEGLRRLVPDPLPSSENDMWILHHPDVRRVYRIRLFADFIAEAIKSDVELFEGRRPLNP